MTTRAITSTQPGNPMLIIQPGIEPIAPSIVVVIMTQAERSFAVLRAFDLDQSRRRAICHSGRGMRLSPAPTGFVALALVAIALALLRPICDPDFLHVAKPQAASLAMTQGAGEGQSECSVSDAGLIFAPTEALVHYADAAGLSQAPGFAIAQPAAVILRWAASTAPPLVSKYYARSARVLR